MCGIFVRGGHLHGYKGTRAQGKQCVPLGQPHANSPVKPDASSRPTAWAVLQVCPSRESSSGALQYRGGPCTGWWRPQLPTPKAGLSAISRGGGLARETHCPQASPCVPRPRKPPPYPLHPSGVIHRGTREGGAYTRCITEVPACAPSGCTASVLDSLSGGLQPRVRHWGARDALGVSDTV